MTHGTTKAQDSLPHAWDNNPLSDNASESDVATSVVTQPLEADPACHDEDDVVSSREPPDEAPAAAAESIRADTSAPPADARVSQANIIQDCVVQPAAGCHVTASPTNTAAAPATATSHCQAAATGLAAVLATLPTCAEHPGASTTQADTGMALPPSHNSSPPLSFTALAAKVSSLHAADEEGVCAVADAGMCHALHAGGELSHGDSGGRRNSHMSDTCPAFVAVSMLMLAVRAWC